MAKLYRSWKTIRALLIHRLEVSKFQTLSRQTIESEAYLFRAAMSELRNEIQTLRRNESAGYRQDLAVLHGEADALELQMREDLNAMRNDVTLEVDNRKAASRAEDKTLDIKIHELNNRMTKRLGDLRTEVEAHKWRLTRTMVSTIITAVIATILLSTWREKRQQQQLQERNSKTTQTDSQDRKMESTSAATGDAFISMG